VKLICNLRETFYAADEITAWKLNQEYLLRYAMLGGVDAYFSILTDDDGNELAYFAFELRRPWNTVSNPYLQDTLAAHEYKTKKQHTQYFVP